MLTTFLVSFTLTTLLALGGVLGYHLATPAPQPTVTVSTPTQPPGRYLVTGTVLL